MWSIFEIREKQSDKTIATNFSYFALVNLLESLKDSENYYVYDPNKEEDESFKNMWVIDNE